ncbi:biotin transporter BioY [Selenihalanaerobacter shriftii]|uniref:Biotin transporter n=1 Tax=Selenihalanaerobacter shriftii TaxID=142842 RepID=A0A1T4QVW0_9FIRM|nr:biotin transporter BioY [Selenihalanaerobacter shriftii]SKA07458.1 biotin transport system substrate-specific component [Selenihalanaerobacter shriftii]
MDLTVKEMIVTALFAALTAIGALIAIPIGAVPITLQILFTLTAGALLGPKLGGLSQILYLLIGAVGLPVYAGGGAGFAYLVGPTGGFLFSFPIAAYIVGRLSEQIGELEFKGIIISMITGLILIYILGVVGLMVATNMGIKGAITAGVLPFIIPDLIKILAGTYLTLRLKNIK